jgi:hypothetical protein
MVTRIQSYKQQRTHHSEIGTSGAWQFWDHPKTPKIHEL